VGLWVENDASENPAADYQAVTTFSETPYFIASGRLLENIEP
jgi:hypothetical protein